MQEETVLKDCGRGAGGGGGGGYYGGGGGVGGHDPSINPQDPASPGTQTGPGIAGATNWLGCNCGNRGTNGSFGIGGDGGNEVLWGQFANDVGAIGGNGGGLDGAYGNIPGPWTGASGAGGSSYIGGVTGGSTTEGLRSGDGLVTISFNLGLTATTNTNFPITAQGTTVVTWTYDDGNGNTSTQTQNVIIDDITAPQTTYLTTSITTPSSGQTSGWSPWVYSFSDPIPAGKYVTGVDLSFNAVDQGWGGTNHNATLKVAGTKIGAVRLTHSQQAYTINYTGAIPGYVYGATNNLEMFFTGWPGWAAKWKGGTLTFHYNGLPDLTAECEVTSITAPTATDNCGATITGTTTDPLSYHTQGTHVITWSFDDGNGNVTTETQNVIIDDVTAPVADVATLADVTAECEVASITAPIATDNCEGVITGTTTDPLAYNTQGTHVITWSFDDGNGNVANETQNVVIDDVTAPVADVATLADVTAECEVASITAPTANG